ncbi:MAG: hydrolase [Planctomycetes bacterium]|nr:hydrolase [Planctomycetota bacterium]
MVPERPDIQILDLERSLLVMVDVQERLVPVMRDAARMISRLSVLLRGCVVLGVPVLISEQYPRGLGPTLEVLSELVPEAQRIEKTSFSCTGSRAFNEALRATERDQIVLCGIEAHICVAQTALGLRRAGYEVFCVEDAVSSRLDDTRSIGIARMRAAGVLPGAVESVLFEWQDRCDREGFKSLSGLVKELA